MRRNFVWSLVAFAALFALGNTAAAQPEGSCKDSPWQGGVAYPAHWNGAALPLDVMREYLDMKWPQRAIEAADPFPAREMIAAIAALKDRTPPKGELLSFEMYVPPGGPQPPYEYTYDEAAGHYRARNFAEAMPLFDAIVSDKRSPYRAAAAYSAARAALMRGRYEDGIGRLDRLIDDPQLVEFRAAALKLVGTLQYQHGSAPLIAARFAQIAYLVSASPQMVCRYPALVPVIAEARDDLAWLESQKSPDPREATRDPPISYVMDSLAPSMPYVDLLRVTGSPTPYDHDFGWADDLSFIAPPESRLRGHIQRMRDRPNEGAYDSSPVSARAKELTAHARARWKATRNVLWAFALAGRSADVADVAIVREALASLATKPATPEQRLSNLFLRRHLTAQGARILLMAGHADQAIALLREQLTTIKHIKDIEFPGWYRGSDTGRWSTSFVLNGGVRWLLQRRDLAGARKWAKDAAAVLDADSNLFGLKLRPDVQLEVLLAVSPAELVTATLAEGRTSYGGGEALFAVADLLPAKTLVNMSAEPRVARDIRRALLAAGWTRLHLLGRDDEARALLPRVRELFPELAGDIDDIANAWFSFTRDHAITRMLLRAPGFLPRSRWFKPGRLQQGIFAIDGQNPSDGNWWCPLDLSLLKTEMLFEYYAHPLRTPSLHVGRYGSYTSLPQSNRAAAVAQADQLIAWHPLFKAMDNPELEALSRIESGPKLLSERAVAWASWSNWLTWVSGFDKHLPETLHLAVRSTRYGCRRNGPHGTYSRTAFEYLHDHYPSSEWTKKTPFWFDKQRRF